MPKLERKTIFILCGLAVVLPVIAYCAHEIPVETYRPSGAYCNGLGTDQKRYSLLKGETLRGIKATIAKRDEESEKDRRRNPSGIEPGLCVSEVTYKLYVW